MAGETMRTQMEMSEERVCEIEALMKKCGVRTKKEFFNYALTFLKWAIRETREGRTIVSIDEKSGKIKEIEMPIFDAVRQRSGSLCKIG